ncbi:MAG TPA: hypothetical protein VFX13_19590 [Gaiellales bacterium]|nr:hypothetical protein [Gaiellales bacterium]
MTIAPPATHPHEREGDRHNDDGCDCGFTVDRCRELCTRSAKRAGICQCRREERARR